MTVVRALRYLLALIAVLIIAWAFIDVGMRTWRKSSTPDDAITLTILHWGNPAEDGIVRDLVAKYTAQCPRVRIVRINASDMRSKLKTMMAAGTPPDLFYLPPDLLPEMAQLKLIRPVDDYIAAEQSAGKGAWIDDFYPVLLDAYRYDANTQRVGAGPLYGLPKDFTTAVYYVNVNLFIRAGLRVPYDGWTWDEFESDMCKITALSGTPAVDGRKVYGGFFQLWPDTLRNVLWTFGGEFFGPAGFRDVALDEPGAQQALDLIVRTRINDQTVYNPTGIAKEGGQEFINGNIGCIGPIGRWMVPTYAGIKSFTWDVVPVPSKTPELRSSQLFTTAWTMSAATKHPDECFRLMKFLCGPEGAAMQSRLGLAIPPLKSVAESKDFLEPEGLPKHRSQIFLDGIAHARLQQVPREAEWGRIVGDKITKSISLGTVTPMENAREIESTWLKELDSPLRLREWKPVRWSMVVAIAAGAVATIACALWWRARREKLGPLDRAQERTGFAFILPWLIGFLMLTLGPMIASLLLSFTKWSAMTPITDAQSVGVANYAQFLTADDTFVQSLKVTGYFVLLAVPIGQIAALAVAMLMNMKVRGITIFRTVYFVPSVVTGAVLSVMWLQIFNNDYGILNKAVAPIAKLFGTTPPDWFGRDIKIWGIPAFVIMGLWGVGGGMIIYLAGLKGIPASYYEAATVDGAGPIRKFWNVTLPMLSPLLFYNLVMGIIGSFQVFTQAYMMTGAGTDNATLFYVLNLYRQAFEFHNMGYASAMAWVLFVIVLVLTMLLFRGSKNLVYYEGLKA